VLISGVVCVFFNGCWKDQPDQTDALFSQITLTKNIFLTAIA
jgi:hypothetical protein